MNQTNKFSENGWGPTLALLVLAALAVPFSLMLNRLPVLNEKPVLLFIFGVGTLSAVGAIAYFGIVRRLPEANRRSPYPVFFAVFAFAAILDLMIGLTLLGYTDAMRGYIANGEPYLDSSHGMAINLWDGIIHFSLYLWIINCMAAGREHRRSTLFWAGSISMSVIIYMVGNTIGPYAEHIEPSYLLNVPFMIVPVLYALKVVGRSSATTTAESNGGKKRRGNVIDWLLVLAISGVVGISVYRLLVVINPATSLTAGWVKSVEPYLTDASQYPRVQMLAFGFYLLPFGVFAIKALVGRPSPGISHWAWFMAGGVAQAQFAHIVASVSAASRQGIALSPVFWITNIVILIVPLLMAWRIHTQRAGRA